MSSLEISPAEAVYILDRLSEERRFSLRDLRRFRMELRQQITALESRIASLRGNETQPTASTSVPGKRGPGRPRTGKAGAKKKAGTPASQRLQGQYLALIRAIKPDDRAAYSVIAKEKGREAAIEAMRKALGK